MPDVILYKYGLISVSCLLYQALLVLALKPETVKAWDNAIIWPYPGLYRHNTVHVYLTNSVHTHTHARVVGVLNNLYLNMLLVHVCSKCHKGSIFSPHLSINEYCVCKIGTRS